MAFNTHHKQIINSEQRSSSPFLTGSILEMILEFCEGYICESPLFVSSPLHAIATTNRCMIKTIRSMKVVCIKIALLVPQDWSFHASRITQFLAAHPCARELRFFVHPEYFLTSFKQLFAVTSACYLTGLRQVVSRRLPAIISLKVIVSPRFHFIDHFSNECNNNDFDRVLFSFDQSNSGLFRSFKHIELRALSGVHVESLKRYILLRQFDGAMKSTHSSSEHHHDIILTSEFGLVGGPCIECGTVKDTVSLNCDAPKCNIIRFMCPIHIPASVLFKQEKKTNKAPSSWSSIGQDAVVDKGPQGSNMNFFTCRAHPQRWIHAECVHDVAAAKCTNHITCLGDDTFLNMRGTCKHCIALYENENNSDWMCPKHRLICGKCHEPGTDKDFAYRHQQYLVHLDAPVADKDYVCIDCLSNINE